MVAPTTEVSQPTKVEDISDHDPLGLAETDDLANHTQTEQETLSPPPAFLPPLLPNASASPFSEITAKTDPTEAAKSQAAIPDSSSNSSAPETNTAIGWTNSMPPLTISNETNTLFTGQMAHQDLLQALSAVLAAGTLAKPAAELKTNRRRSIAVCLANPEDVEVVVKVLGQHDYELTVASSPEEVTSMLQTSHHLDVLLLDPNFHAGQHGGAVIMRYLNMLNPARRRRVFVVVTSHTYRTQDMQAAFTHGVNLVLNSNDLALLPNVLAKSIQDFNDLYRAFNQVSGVSAF
jgi:CheY-like chemotaxis protein